MKDIKIKIECPEGYQIDEENSDIKNGIIKFKQKKLTYNDFAEYQLVNKVDTHDLQIKDDMELFVCILE